MDIMLESPDWGNPEHINDAGFKFWLDRSSTDYARNKGLDDYHVLFTEHPDGKRTRILVNGNNEPVCDDPSIEGIAVYIDLIAANKNYDKMEANDDGEGISGTV